MKTCLIITPWSSGPVFPEGFSCNWMTQRLLLDENFNPVRSLIAVDLEDEAAARVQAKEFPTLEWVGSVDPIEGRYLNIAEATAAKANDLFKVKLDALTQNGYTDAETGFKIKGDDRAMKERWTPQTTAVLNMKNLGVPGTTVMTTFDFNDAPIQMTLDQFQGLMLRFSVWFNEKFSQAAAP